MLNEAQLTPDQDLAVHRIYAEDATVPAEQFGCGRWAQME